MTKLPPTARNEITTTHDRLKAVQAFIREQREKANSARERIRASCHGEEIEYLEAEVTLADGIASGVESSLSILFDPALLG